MGSSKQHIEFWVIPTILFLKRTRLFCLGFGSSRHKNALHLRPHFESSLQHLFEKKKETWFCSGFGSTRQQTCSTVAAQAPLWINTATPFKNMILLRFWTLDAARMLYCRSLGFILNQHYNILFEKLNFAQSLGPRSNKNDLLSHPRFRFEPTLQHFLVHDSGVFTKSNPTVYNPPRFTRNARGVNFRTFVCHPSALATIHQDHVCN